MMPWEVTDTNESMIASKCHLLGCCIPSEDAARRKAVACFEERAYLRQVRIAEYGELHPVGDYPARGARWNSVAGMVLGGETRRNYIVTREEAVTLD